MTTPTIIQMLHIEDDRVQQTFVKRHLSSLSEYSFVIQNVSTEDDAVEAFNSGTFDLVILDYHLDQGDGFKCLTRIRQADAMIPIIAMSGVASHEIASNLIEAGADDYLDKMALNGSTLTQSVRNVLTRAKAFRSRFATLPQNTEMTGEMTTEV